MSLTTSDKDDMRTLIREEVRPIIREEVRPIVREEVESVVSVKLKPIEDKIDRLDGKVVALQNDVKAIYNSLDHAGIAVVSE